MEGQVFGQRKDDPMSWHWVSITTEQFTDDLKYLLLQRGAKLITKVKEDPSYAVERAICANMEYPKEEFGSINNRITNKNVLDFVGTGGLPIK